MQTIKDFKTATDGTGTTSVTGKIQFLRNMLRREAPREFNDLAGQVAVTTITHLKFIKERLLWQNPPVNSLTKQNRAMRRTMRKPQDLLFKRFSAQLTELNNYLPLFPGSIADKKMSSQELNGMLLHSVPNIGAKQAYLQGWDFEGKSFKDTCNVSERI